jgi:hypothetical protein
LRYLGKALVLRLLGPDILAFACKDAETVGRFDINTIKYNRVYFVSSICGSWSRLMCKRGTETLFRIAFMLLLYKKSMPLNCPLTLSNNSERHNFTLPTYAQAAKKVGCSAYSVYGETNQGRSTTRATRGEPQQALHQLPEQEPLQYTKGLRPVMSMIGNFGSQIAKRELRICLVDRYI